jgi:hypothetical protein
MHTGWDAPGMAAKQGRDARLGWNPGMKGAVVAPYPPGKTRFTSLSAPDQERAEAPLTPE